MRPSEVRFEPTAPSLLVRQAIRAGVWAIRSRAVDRGLGLARTLILVRILAPADFGLFGLATLTISALEVFSQTGLTSALVQRRGDVDRYLDVAWTIQALRGTLLAGATWLLATVVADFFSTPNAVPLMRALGLAFLFQGLANVGIVKFRRDLELHRQFGFTLAGAVADIGVAIVVAVLGGGAWALVLGFLAGHIVRSGASFLVHPFRPRPRLDLAKARELFIFGRWIFASGIVIFLVTQGDDAVVGKMIGVAALGFYQMAYLLSNLPASQVTHVISEVSFPVYAKLQTDAPRLRTAYLHILEGITAVSLPLAASVFIAATEIVGVFLGEEWLPMVPSLQILAGLGALRSIGAANGSLFHGIGRPRVDTEIAVIHLVLMTVLIIPMAKAWGIAGVAGAVTFPMLVSQGYGSLRVCRELGGGLGEMARRIAVPAMGALLLAIVYSVAKLLLSSAPVTLLVGGPLAAATYVIFLRVALSRVAGSGRETALSFLVREFRTHAYDYR